MDQTAKPLRLLGLVNSPWDERLGAPRVWMELAAQWRADGHVVENYSLSDAFPGVRAARVTFALRQLLFMRKAAAFVRQNAGRFDVIDALIGTLPVPRESLGFSGLLVARSVGLHRLYERFDRSIASRWPQPVRGKWSGRLLYQFTRRRLLFASDAAVQNADLLNLPNEEEAECLRTESNPRAQIFVQPYGLTEAGARALREAAAAPATRLAAKRICFIGMWSPRKGAHDWPGIIARVQREEPGARFRFLGTMVDEATIRQELGEHAAGVEFISKFEPNDLPRLLADCTVGAFPSYVEGFGLAVLEQLAAGLPTIAYETAGPRDILQRDLPECLVPSGNVDAFGAALCRVLHMEAGLYEGLSKRCHAAAARFSWQEIARRTIEVYRRALAARERPVVFAQPFSLGSAGGGARILRGLLAEAPFGWRSISTAATKPKPWRDELHVRRRPSWGALEHSRLAALPNATARFFAGSFRRRLHWRCRELNARALHAVAHGGLDFSLVQAVARELRLPFFLSLHDDLAYTLPAPARAAERERAMQEAWREAAARFVISEALGREYSRRYGERPFEIVTDGLTELAAFRPNETSKVLRIYFMGLFHMSYEENLRALLAGIALLERQRPELRVHLTLRCEHVRSRILAARKDVTVLPFASEAQVQRDLKEADLLYMPMPFGEEHASFARYSLSTKMVTYVGSAVPILYHGPTCAAAFALLAENKAALLATSLDPAEIAATLAGADETNRRAVATNALALARRDFMLEQQSARFCGTIARVLAEV